MKSSEFLNIPQRWSLCWARGPTYTVHVRRTLGSGVLRTWATVLCTLGFTYDVLHAWDLRTAHHVGVIGAGQVVRRAPLMRL